jgi:negative regulator of sigma E activity
MMRRRRVARVAVGSAVVAGTAGAVHHYQDGKYAEQDAAQPQENYEQEQGAPPPEQYAPPAPEEDMTAKLQELAQLHESGALTDEEFAAAKSKLLAG